MTRTELTLALTLIAGVAGGLPSSAHAQDLAARVRAVAGDAEIRFAARPGVCGNGDDGVSFRSPNRADDEDDNGWWSTCQPGPVRVRFTVQNGTVSAIHTSVGTPHRPPAGVTDLGVVGDHDAVAYLTTLAREAPDAVARKAVTPLALADSVTITPTLLALANDRARPTKVRTSALFWASEVGETNLTPELARIASDTSDVQRLREQAVFVLAQRDDSASTDALFAIVRSDPDRQVRKRALFWLGQSHDPRVVGFLTDILEH